MNQIYYGSNYGYYSPQPPSSGYEGKPTEIVGFRLVHDSVDRVERGGSCLLDSFNAVQARGYPVNPAFPSSARGFRLARAEA